jgi:hypothetical protein
MRMRIFHLHVPRIISGSTFGWLYSNEVDLMGAWTGTNFLRKRKVADLYEHGIGNLRFL